jgi:hypothetical protein
MRLFGLLATGAWIGFGYAIGTHNLIAAIIFPVLALIVSIFGVAYDLLKPVEPEKAGWDE